MHAPANEGVYKELRAEFTAAFFANPLTLLPTPAAPRARMRLVDIVAECCAVGDDLGIVEHACTVAASAAEGSPSLTRMQAMALVGRLAHLYATEHADDVARMRAEA